jgi:hypothetical protein
VSRSIELRGPEITVVYQLPYIADELPLPISPPDPMPTYAELHP